MPCLGSIAAQPTGCCVPVHTRACGRPGYRSVGPSPAARCLVVRPLVVQGPLPRRRLTPTCSAAKCSSSIGTCRIPGACGVPSSTSSRSSSSCSSNPWRCQTTCSRLQQQQLTSRRQQQLGRLCTAAVALPWQQAWSTGLNLRCFMVGVVFTLGAQLLLQLLLRLRAVRRVLAAFNTWLLQVFGFSFRGLSQYEASSSSTTTADAEPLLEVVGERQFERVFSNGSSSSSSSSAQSGHVADGRKLTRKERTRQREQDIAHHMLTNQPGESVEWVNMCFRKSWRVYQRGLEQWITDLLQPVFDGLVEAGSVPRFVQRLRIVELTLDHEAPYVSNMRRRNSRKDSDLTGVVDLRYTGGARMLLMLEVGSGRWRFKVPVLVSDLDLECKMWLKVRLAPMCPWIGTISLAFVGPPNVKVQLSPYNRVRLMRIPVLQSFLNQLLTVDLPGLMVLPERLEINIPPSVTSVAEAAVGRDVIMRAVASAVLQVDSLEQALLAALPLGPQTAAGGVSLPEFFRGELSVMLREGRSLPVWGLPWQSNPWCRLVLGEQAVSSRRDNDTGQPGRHRNPVWNQEVQFLVEDLDKQVLEVYVNDSHLTGRPKVGKAIFRLRDLPEDGAATIWLPLVPVNPGQTPQGEVLMDITYKPFVDDEQDSGYREAQAFAEAMQQQQETITDIRSAAAASSRAAVAASAAISAIAMTKAAAARAAARAARAAKEAGAAALSSVTLQQQQQAAQKQQEAEQEQSEAQQIQDALKDALVEAINKQRQQQGGNGSSSGNGAAATATPPLALPPLGTSSSSSSSAGVAAVDQAEREEVSAAASADADQEPSVLETWSPEEEEVEEGEQEEEDEEVTQRVQRATQEIRERTQQMEAAVAELAQLAAGSPAEAVLQEGAARAHLAAEQAIAALSTRTASPHHQQHSNGSSRNGSSHSSSSSMDGEEAVAAADAVQQLLTASALDAAAVSEGMLGAVSVDSSSKRAVAVLEAPPSSSPVDVAAPGSSSSSSWTATAPPVPGGVSAGSDDLGQLVGGGGSSSITRASGSSEGVPPGQLLGVLNATHQLQEQQQQQQQRRKAAKAAQVQHQVAEAAAAAGVGGATATSSSSKQQRRKKAAGQQPPPDGGSPAPPPAAAAAEEAAEESPWWRGMLQPWVRAPAASKGATGAGDASAATTSSSSSKRPMQSLDMGGSTDPGQAMLNSEPLSTSQRAWWEPLINSDFVKSLPVIGGDKGKPAAEDGADASSKKDKQQQEQQQDEQAAAGSSKQEQRAWWDVGALLGKLTGGGKEEKERGDDGAGADGGSKPVEAIFIPPDLPIEEIAKEVAKLKEESWRSKEDHVESLWARAVERNDRSWVMLLCFLITVAVGLLAVVAYRLDMLATMGTDATPPAEQGLEQLPLLLLGLLAAYFSVGGP